MTNINKLLEMGITERGNTSLVNYETGACVFFSEVEEGKWLEIAHSPENYPAWNVATLNISTKDLRTQIEDSFSDPWIFQKNNIGANAASNSPVDIEYVMERVRDHLYVYRDNKDYETDDTVTSIHNFLKKNEWTLGIPAIESLKQESDEV